MTMASQSLREYLLGRNITSIVTFGDSQGLRYSAAFREIFKAAGFNCKQVKAEPSGFQTSLDYYTKGTGFTTHAKVQRTCTSCVSNLHICSDTKHTERRRVAVEYISMQMTSQKPINLSHPDCQKNETFHPLCLNLTQQEYVLKYYIKRQHHPFPQLMLLFSAIPHHQWKPLAAVYDGYVALL